MIIENIINGITNSYLNIICTCAKPFSKINNDIRNTYNTIYSRTTFQFLIPTHILAPTQLLRIYTKFKFFKIYQKLKC